MIVLSICINGFKMKIKIRKNIHSCPIILKSEPKSNLNFWKKIMLNSLLNFILELWNENVFFSFSMNNVWLSFSCDMIWHLFEIENRWYKIYKSFKWRMKVEGGLADERKLVIVDLLSRLKSQPHRIILHNLTGVIS